MTKRKSEPKQQQQQQPKSLTMPPMSTEGIKLDQLLTMLMAAQAQGATHVRLACQTIGGDGIQSDIDWVSMSPVDEKYVYIGAIRPFDEWEHASNAALESLDW